MNGMTFKTISGGFTILELVIVMAIAAILLAIGVPTFQGATSGASAAWHEG